MRNYTNEHLLHFTLEELERFSDNQLAKVSIEGLKSLLRIRSDEKKEEERIQRFWQAEYPALPAEEKAKYWAAGLFRGMRSQEESGLNPYAIYTENWLKETLKQEPNFIDMLPMIYNVWGGMFDAAKVDRIIRRHLKNISL
jgi:hypothetical protein